MEKIIELFMKKEKMISAEQKAFWREELLYLIESQKTSDILLNEIASILKKSINKAMTNGVEELLKENFNLFLKYLDKPKEILKKNIFSLIDLSEIHLSNKNKRFIWDNYYFLSKELSKWAWELYYLIRKLEKNDVFIQRTLALLKTARRQISKEERDELKENLKNLNLRKNKMIDLKNLSKT